jgi:2-amino-4-hydroxy-6-hydroxymethyldihydropteridine diphosphokinase
LNQVYLGIGSNKNHPYFRINTVLRQINRIKSTNIVKKSGLYVTKPLGPQAQPNFINSVIEIKTNLEPLELLYELQNLEKLHNRKKTKRWGPRSMDIDILIYNNLIMNTNKLVIPHPGLKYRDFVLIPLYEITSYGYEIPKYGKIITLIKNLS